MKSFLNVKIYDEVEILHGPHFGKKVILFSDDKGNDWYEVRNSWDAVVMVDPETDVICAVESDVERLTISAGMNLYEVKKEQIPKDLLLGTYKFLGGDFALIAL